MKTLRGEFVRTSIVANMDDGEVRWAGASSSTFTGEMTHLKEVVWRRNTRIASNTLSARGKMTGRRLDYAITSFLNVVEIV